MGTISDISTALNARFGQAEDQVKDGFTKAADAVVKEQTSHFVEHQQYKDEKSMENAKINASAEAESDKWYKEGAAAISDFESKIEEDDLTSMAEAYADLLATDADLDQGIIDVSQKADDRLKALKEQVGSIDDILSVFLGEELEVGGPEEEEAA